MTSMDALKNKIAIVGVGTTEYGNFPQFSDYALGAKAFKAAVEDCGIDKNQIDGLVCCRVPFYARMGEVLGLNPRWTLQIRHGNFKHPFAIRKNWPGSHYEQNWFDLSHPEYVAP